MRVWNCPLCTCEDCVERIPEDKEKAKCDACKAVFKVENDYSHDTETWVDYSELGEEVKA